MPTEISHTSLPAHIKLRCWAIAAGALGFPVHILIRDHQTSLVANLYTRFVQWVGYRRAIYLHVERDIHKLENRLEESDPDKALRLVLVTNAKLIARVCWILSSRPFDPANGNTSRPVLFAQQRTLLCDDLPGPILTLHGQSSQARLATEWLEGGGLLSPFPAYTPNPRVVFDVLDEIFRACNVPAHREPLRLTDKEIVKGLIAGAALLRLAGTQLPAKILIGHEDYREIYDPVRLAATQSIDSAFDPLALFMVQRANVYLKLQAAREANRPSLPHESLATSDCRITRRELADLGNVRGTTVRSLVARLHAMGKQGLADFITLGMNQQMKNADDWPASAPDALVGFLLSWSMKQVRTHFERLHTEGFITGVRGSANQPWKYQIPEALGNSDSPLKALPNPYTLTPQPSALGCPLTRADQSS